MSKEHMFVNIMMLLQVGAVGQYMWNKNWAIALYWASCLAINYVVTYKLGNV